MACIWFCIDPVTGLPHIYSHGVEEREVIEVLQTATEEDKAALSSLDETIMTVPSELVPAFRALISKQ